MNISSKTIKQLLAIAGLVVLAGTAQAGSFADDRAEIENLMATYIFALDLKDADAYANTFTEDGVINHAGGIERGRDMIRAFVQRSAANAKKALAERDSSLPKFIPGRHSIGNLEITEIKGNTGKGRAYWSSMGVDENGKAHVSEYGFYVDEYERVNGKWLFSKRLIVNEFREGREHGVVKAEY